MEGTKVNKVSLILKFWNVPQSVWVNLLLTSYHTEGMQPFREMLLKVCVIKNIF